ncbi:MAG: SUMF1/EgtB/PvdO family nonheme iron enzyme [Bacteroidetes bacterium]|nr:SUMF1/EgtB/PvdO family nonheme iron enzyme [Bacteroidota bacterium]
MKSTYLEMHKSQSWWDYARILTVFAITGTTSSFFPKWIMPLTGLEKGLLFWLVYVLMITPIYFTLLLVVAFIFGKFQFFFDYEKKMIQWIRQKIQLFSFKQGTAIVEQTSFPSHLEEIINNDFSHIDQFQVFENLVTNWLTKEDILINSTHKWQSGDEKKAFCRLIARSLYNVEKSEGRKYLQRKEFEQLVKDFHDDTFALKVNHHSAITFNQESEEYIFAHPSLFSYFLAAEAFENPSFLILDPLRGKKKAFIFFQQMVLRTSMQEIAGTIMSREDKNGSTDMFFKKFHMGKYLVTVADYRLYCEMTGTEMPVMPSWGWQENLPIVNVSWFDAMDYCQWLSQLTGLHYRLPTVSEWEFAATGGDSQVGKDDFAGGKDLKELGWYNKNSDRQPHPVGKKKPNKIGIYDLSGNVWEWCKDIDESFHSDDSDEKDLDQYTSIKGGSWLNGKDSCKIHISGKMHKSTCKNMIGFRVVVTD